MKTKLLYNTKEKKFILRVIDRSAEIEYQELFFENKKDAINHQKFLLDLHKYKTFI